MTTRLGILSLTFPALLAASPAIGHTDARVPLYFETGAHGALVARQGPYELAVESGATTLTVRDRATGRAARVTTRLSGGNTTARPAGEDPLAARANYLLGEPAQWRVDVPLYRRAVTRGAYPAIDLVFHG
ncbi:MAG: hypothetical protein KGN36_18285, partial [Acidobacteriota bacterium]|nr:hypothetical protein [Acidobacteriota bacterium]